MFEKTNVDGIMIARATLGNPWIFKEIISYLKNESIFEISNEEKLKTILKHIEWEVEEKGEMIAIRELRKHMAAYIKNMPNASQLRNSINKIETKNELEACLIEYFKS